MDNRHDTSYYGNLSVGGQHMQGVFDTGSIELVVLSKKCASFCGEIMRTLYNPLGSPTYVRGNYSLVLSYGSGQLLGQEAYEKVEFGPFSATTAPFWEVVDAQMPLLLSSKFEAIIGLGPIPPHVVNLKPGAKSNRKGFAVLLESMNLSHSQYSVCLGKEPGSPGYVTWNDGSPAAMPETFTTLSVAGGNYWLTKLTDIRIGEVPFACSQGCGAILDSGTSLLSIPSKDKHRLVSKVAQMIDDCRKLNLPNLRFKLDGVEFTLPPDSYLAEVFGLPGVDISEHFNAKNQTECQVSVMTADMTSSLGSTWIFGMPFFREYYTVFAQRQGRHPPRIHTALASDTCNPVTETNAGSLQSFGHQRQVRRLDASKLRMPPWLHKARLAGHIEESALEERLALQEHSGFDHGMKAQVVEPSGVTTAV